MCAARHAGKNPILTAWNQGSPMASRRSDIAKQSLLSLESLGNIFRLGKNDTIGGESVTLRVLVVDDHPASAEGLRAAGR